MTFQKGFYPLCIHYVNPNDWKSVFVFRKMRTITMILWNQLRKHIKATYVIEICCLDMPCVCRKWANLNLSKAAGIGNWKVFRQNWIDVRWWNWQKLICRRWRTYIIGNAAYMDAVLNALLAFPTCAYCRPHSKFAPSLFCRSIVQCLSSVYCMKLCCRHA